MKKVDSFFTYGTIPKGPDNPDESSEGVSIRSFSKCFEHFDFPIKKGDYYYIICFINEVLARVKIKFNSNRGDGYINREEWEIWFGKRFPAGVENKKHIEIRGIESETGLSAYSYHIKKKSNNPNELKEQKIYNKCVRSKQPKKDRYIKYYNLDINNLVDYNGNKISYKNMSIDHIVSVKDAFELGWPIEKTNDWSNLRIMSLSENIKKGSNSDFNSIGAIEYIKKTLF